MIDLSLVRHVVLDMDGTLYKGARLFAQTVPFLNSLRTLGITRTFLTNNTSRSHADYIAKLKRLGIEARENEIYTPAESVIAYLRNSLPGKEQVALLGTPSLVAQFAQAGFTLNWEAPDVVVVGFDTTLDYERLCRAAYWISQGIPYLATHPDLICPTDEPTVLVDCGSICACLNAATNRKPLVFGKPNPSILLEILASRHLKAEQMLMVGDRLYTDMEMALSAGVPAVLVLTGEATAEQAGAMPRQPDLVVSDVGQLGELLVNAQAGNRS